MDKISNKSGVDAPRSLNASLSGEAGPAPTIGSSLLEENISGCHSFSASCFSFAIFLGILILCFIKPLVQLTGYAVKSELNSHVLLIPFIVAYLVRLQRSSLPLTVKPAPVTGLIFMAAGLVTAAITWIFLRSTNLSHSVNYLSATTLSFVICLIGGGFLFLGTAVMRRLAFPSAFLIFLIPLPNVLTHWAEVFFQYTSAEAANIFIGLSGTSYIHDGLLFRLPGITIRVAEECSGIRSSLVLFITSVLASHLFLVTSWKKLVFALAVIPLGILRNGFRIFTIAMLCAHIDPRMIDSPIHHRGGPLFFLLSLVPFFVLLKCLRKTERRIR